MIRRLVAWLGRLLIPAGTYEDFGRPVPPRRERRQGGAGMLDRSLDRPAQPRRRL